jgi:energy-coupling factor transport system permease protein
MDLRGFGKNKTRTWYTSRKMVRLDHTALIVSVLIFLGTFCVSLFVNHSRFYNPFL